MYFCAQVQKQFRNVDLDGTNFTTRAAQARRVRQLRGLCEPNQLGCDYRADRPGINRAISMTADLLVDRTGIQACATANTGERLTRRGRSQHSRATVIEQNDMQLFRS